jgi:hypothetical protein
MSYWTAGPPGAGDSSSSPTKPLPGGRIPRATNTSVAPRRTPIPSVASQRSGAQSAIEVLTKALVCGSLGLRSDSRQRLRISPGDLHNPRVEPGCESLLYSYVDLVTEPGRAPGCLILNSSLPVVDDHLFRKRFAEQRESLRQSLQKRFRQALQDRDKLPVDSDPAALAQIGCCSNMGTCC